MGGLRLHLLIQPVAGGGEELQTLLNQLQLIPICPPALLPGANAFGELQQTADGPVHMPGTQKGQQQHNAKNQQAGQHSGPGDFGAFLGDVGDGNHGYVGPAVQAGGPVCNPRLPPVYFGIEKPGHRLQPCRPLL
ncbi:hypothetical protein D3C75_658700 [compost metagenome]